MRRVERRPVDADGLLPALDLLTEPFAAAAVTEVVALTDGVVATGRPLRAPAILVRLKQSLARQAVVVRCTVDGAPAPAPVTFTAWSAAGSLLPLFVPAVDDTDGSGPVELAVQVWTVGGEAAHDPASALAASSGAPVAAADAAELVEALVVEGHVARVLHTLTAEKQRIVATAREITASRHVGLARAGALDALGAGHGVPRLEGEGDEAYRRRQLIYSSWRLATPAGLEAALNGPPDGTPGGGPNAGLPSAAGVTSRFRVVDETDELAVSVRIVEVTEPPGTWRDRFRELAKAGLLFDLETRPSSNLPAATHARLADVRRRLRENLERAQPVTERRYMSVLAATSLDRLTQLLGTLTGTATVILLGGLSRAEDPRLDLGLGVTVAPLAPDRIDAAIQAARAAQQRVAAGAGAELPDAPAEIHMAILGAEVRDRDVDPIGAWLFTAAGLHASALDPGTIYCTPLPTQGLVIEGAGRLTPGATGRYVARMRGDSGPGRHVLVDEAWQRAAAHLTPDAGGAAPVALSPLELADLLDSLAGLAVAPPVEAALQPLIGLGLQPAAPVELARRVREAYDLDLLVAYVVAPAVGGLAADDPAAVAAREILIADVAALTTAGFHSVRLLPHPDGVRLVVLAAVSVLPGGSNRPGQAAPAMYRWYLVPLAVTDGGVFEDRRWHGVLPWSRRYRDRRPSLALRQGVGGQVELEALRPGLTLVVCLAHTRRNGADPYEVRIELPDEDAVLDMDQYGYLMNLLEHVCPLGVEINTFDIRRRHVAAGGGAPEFLSGRVSRSYTRYRRRRPAGAERYAGEDSP